MKLIRFKLPKAPEHFTMCNLRSILAILNLVYWSPYAGKENLGMFGINTYSKGLHKFRLYFFVQVVHTCLKGMQVNKPLRVCPSQQHYIHHAKKSNRTTTLITIYFHVFSTLNIQDTNLETFFYLIWNYIVFTLFRIPCQYTFMIRKASKYIYIFEFHTSSLKYWDSLENHSAFIK